MPSEAHDDGSEKKIIIDEDWKTQVQAEKKAAETAKSEPDAAHEAAGQGFPPATFSTLCSTLATQAIMALGQMPNPITNEAQVDLAQAKHFIDTLGMLEEKTQGNLTPEESALLTNLLYEFRMAFVAVQSGAGGGAAGPDTGVAGGSE